MARQKQTTPLRRETSSEYFSKADTPGTPSRNPRDLDRGMNTTTDGSVNGHANGLAVPSIVSPVKKDAGIPQLLIAVGGIYVSLYDNTVDSSVS
jgi:UDP-galactose transporter B1